MQNSPSPMHLVTAATMPQLDSYSSNTLLSLTDYFIRKNSAENYPHSLHFSTYPSIGTPTGKRVPHLIVKCGENHVGTVTEILSRFLNGKIR